jgi:pyruvate dehydrogenase E2 component (dihydrolipoamide acetyltransferase)
MTSNAEVFRLPDLGEGLIEATVVEWLVEVGERVRRNAPLVEVETTKSTVELPCPVDGRVVELHAATGQLVAVGDPLVSFDVAGRPGIVGTMASDAQPLRRVHLKPPPED